MGIWLPLLLIALSLLAQAGLGLERSTPMETTDQALRPNAIGDGIALPVKILNESQERVYSLRYPLFINTSALTTRRTELKSPIPLFEAGANGTALRAVLTVLRMNASLVSPDAYATASDLGGFYYSEYNEPKSVDFTLYPAPLNSQGTQPEIKPFVLELEYPPSASPFLLSYPPSASVQYMKVYNTTLKTVTNTDTITNTTTTYFENNITLAVRITVYNGTLPCLYLSSESTICSANPVFTISIVASDIPGSMAIGSQCVTARVGDRIHWANYTVPRKWTLGVLCVSARVSQVVRTTGGWTYVTCYVDAVTSFHLNPVPSWVFPDGHAPLKDIFSQNYAEGFLEGPAFYYSLSSFLWNMLVENTTRKYRVFDGWELTFLALQIAEEIKLQDVETGDIGVLFTKAGNQSEIQRQVTLIVQFREYTADIVGKKLVMGKYVPWVFSFVAGLSIPIWAVDKMQPYAQVSYQGRENMSILIDPLSHSFGSYWELGGNLVYQPLPAVGQTLIFHMYGEAEPDVPFSYTLIGLQVRFTGYVPGSL